MVGLDLFFATGSLELAYLWMVSHPLFGLDFNWLSDIVLVARIKAFELEALNKKPCLVISPSILVSYVSNILASSSSQWWMSCPLSWWSRIDLSPEASPEELLLLHSREPFSRDFERRLPFRDANLD